ncbi:MAG: hypothetical protein AB8C02_09095 [Halioglobus sp.]
MTTIERHVSIHADTARLYDEFATARCLATWLGPAHFKVNQQFGSVMLTLCGELDFAVSETRSPINITWKCMTKRHAWTNTSVVIGFADVNDGVLVSLSHSLWVDEAGLVAATGEFWRLALESLKLCIEGDGGASVTEFPAELYLP